MSIPKKEALVHIGVRIPPSIRDKVAEIAKKEKAKPSDVYRMIITSFFEASVNKTETKEETSESRMTA